MKLGTQTAPLPIRPGGFDADTFLLSSVRMAATRTRRPVITLIGAGNLAYALGPALRAAGYAIDGVAARETASSRRRAAMLAKSVRAAAVPLAQTRPDADIIWICHTDDALAETAKLLARKPGWKNKIVFHSSGALSSNVLAPLKRKGAYTASLHPMMTFVPGAAPRMDEVPFAVSTTALHKNADLLVIGRSVENGALGRLRTNAYSIIRQSPCPVVSV